MKWNLIPVALLVGCATDIESYIKDFPALEIRVHEHAPGSVILAKCYGDLPLWQKAAGYIPIACTWIDMNKRTCDVFVADNTDPDTIAHEMAHCIGGDHDGMLHRMVAASRATERVNDGGH